MKNTIKNLIIEKNLNTAPILVGFSGGADSSCLLHLIASLKEKLNLKIVAAHLNHGWRAEASDEDENFAYEFSKNLGVDFYSQKLDEAAKKTETNARELRYKFFDEAIEKYGASAIFLAHNKNDNVETLVYRLIKGTGIEGMKSIPPQRNKIFRPLLNFSREEIEAYLKKNSINFREDKSNFNTNFNRNWVRYEILPKFEKINPNYLNNIENLIEVANNECEILENALIIAKREVFEGKKINSENFLKQIYPIKLKLIYNYLKDDLKFYDLVRIKRIVDFIQKTLLETQDPQFRKYKRFSINSKLFLYVNKKEIFKGAYDEKY